MSGCGVVVIDDDRNVYVADCGTQGAPGIPGGAFLDYVRSVPAASWVIDHNFGYRVHVTLLDDAGLYVLAEVLQQAPFNQVTVTFPDPTTGSAHIS